MYTSSYMSLKEHKKSVRKLETWPVFVLDENGIDKKAVYVLLSSQFLQLCNPQNR